MNYRKELEKIYNTKKPDYSKIIDKEIILYGAGSLGHMAFDLLKKAGINPKYIVDKNATGKIYGIKIVTPSEIVKEDKENCLFLICIATVPYNEIFKFLNQLGIKNLLQFYTYAYMKFPQLLSNGWTCYEPTPNDKKEIEKVCEALSHDELSLCHYLQFLWWKIRGIEHIYQNHPVLSEKKYFKSPCIPKLSEHEVLLDAGSHFGQTIESFIKATGDKFDNIYAFDPDEVNLGVCKKNFNNERIIYSNKAIYDTNGFINFQDNLGFASKIDSSGDKTIEAVTIDSLNINPTIIKLHIEGDELNGLQGAKNTIAKTTPFLMVLADHNSDGLYKIPQYIYNLNEYKLYFNLHDYCGNTAIFYGVNK